MPKTSLGVFWGSAAMPHALLSPQQRTFPSVVRAQKCEPPHHQPEPASSSTPEGIASTLCAMQASAPLHGVVPPIVPEPISPALFEPKHSTAPEASRTHDA